MRVDRIRVQGYRSIDDLELQPGALTVLLGPNNAGKSNIVDAVDFLSDVYRSGAKLAIDRKGGFENISFREAGVPRKEITFEITARATMEEIRPFRSRLPYAETGDYGEDSIGALVFRHLFTLSGTGEPLVSDFYVEAEEIQIDQIDPTSNAKRKLVHLRRNGMDVEVSLQKRLGRPGLVIDSYLNDNRDFAQQFLGRLASPREFLSERLDHFSEAFRYFLSHISRARTYQLVPPQCRKSAPPTPDADLEASGGNLPALIYHLKEQNPSAWEQVMHSMSLIVPELERIDVAPTQDRQWTLEFTESGEGRRWRASEVSDGTIRALALFAAAFDSRSSLMSIEEPENAVHPWILRVFIAVCRAVSESVIGKQVIVTTHSPALINHLDPSEIVVVWREDGRTKLRALTELEPGVAEHWAEGKLTLFDLLDSGLLPQSVPGA